MLLILSETLSLYSFMIDICSLPISLALASPSLRGKRARIVGSHRPLPMIRTRLGDAELSLPL